MKKKNPTANQDIQVQDVSFQNGEYMTLSPDQLIPYEFNNKIHPDDQINAIINSITEC